MSACGGLGGLDALDGMGISLEWMGRMVWVPSAHTKGTDWVHGVDGVAGLDGMDGMGDADLDGLAHLD